LQLGLRTHHGNRRMESPIRKPFQLESSVLAGPQSAHVYLVESNIDARLRCIDDLGKGVSRVQTAANKIFDMRRGDPPINR
jgi:hypothetical protein